ncbi:MAG: Hpt domain-containing protein [Planctomycetota bacterium]|jgi:HPt (histidine-containing phosphotransfer) domain-containing protein
MKNEISETNSEICRPGQPSSTHDSKETPQEPAVNTEHDEVIVDWNQISARDLDEEVITEVMPTYMKEKKKCLQQLISAVKNSNVEGVRMHAHAIKGAARNLGIIKLSEMAGHLENMAKEEKLSGAEDLLQEIKKEFGKLESFVSKPNWIEIAKEQAAHKTPADSTAPS